MSKGEKNTPVNEQGGKMVLERLGSSDDGFSVMTVDQSVTGACSSQSQDRTGGWGIGMS